MKKSLLVISLISFSAVAQQGHGGAGGTNKVPQTQCAAAMKAWTDAGKTGEAAVWINNNETKIQILGPDAVNVTTTSGLNKTYELRRTAPKTFEISDDKKAFNDTSKSWWTNRSKDYQGKTFFQTKVDTLQNVWKSNSTAGADTKDPVEIAFRRCAEGLIEDASIAP